MPKVSQHTTTFKPNPLQKGFIESRATADLFSSRRGEGKSVGLCWSILYHTRHNPGANWAVVRDTYENLQKTTMKTFFEWFPPGIYGDYHQTKKEFRWYSGIAEGTVNFVGMDAPDDATRFLSWELAGIAMDEPAPAVGSAGIDEMIFDLGTTCLRQPGMKWYCMKLAENNPDESHWTYKKFVQPGMDNYALWQPSNPENLSNLPADYYPNMRKNLAHRPDLIRRFVDGEFGFQQEGKQVTPQWSDKLHLANGLIPVPRQELTLLWDFGLNPTCIITQVTPQGFWLILDSVVGDGIGVSELIGDVVKPLLFSKYKGYPIRHVGDPNGNMREQSSSKRTAVKLLKRELGGTWRSGPVSFRERRDPLQQVLTKTIGGQGVVQVDRENAKEVWFALRGGWHYHVARTGLISELPKKNMPSHPGDAMGYGAAVLFPTRQFQVQGDFKAPPEAQYFNAPKWRIGPPTGGVKLPKDGAVLR